MSLTYAQHFTYMADYQRKQAEALDMLAKAEACRPGISAEDREWSEAFWMNSAFESRQRAVEYAEMAYAEMREKAA